MKAFVEECIREWHRLGVPQPVANEMAADLTADLDEAEAEGGSPEDVLGNSAFDPRGFAAAWAASRGVTAPAAVGPPLPRRPLLVAVGAVAIVVVVFVAGVVLSVGHGGHAVAIAGPGRLRHFPGGRLVLPGPFGTLGGPQGIAWRVLPLVVLLLLAATVAVAVVIGLVVMWRGAPAFAARRSGRRANGDPARRD